MTLDILVYWSRYIRSGIVHVRLSLWRGHGVFSFQPQVSGSVDEVNVEEETGGEQHGTHVELCENRHEDEGQE